MSQTITLGDQVYEAIGEEPYTRSDGTLTTLVRWRSRCPECGDPFDVLISKTSQIFNPNRRCSKHHKSGRPVGGLHG